MPLGGSHSKYLVVFRVQRGTPKASPLELETSLWQGTALPAGVTIVLVGMLTSNFSSRPTNPKLDSAEPMLLFRALPAQADEAQSELYEIAQKIVNPTHEQVGCARTHARPPARTHH